MAVGYTARLNGADLEVRGFPLGEGKQYEWGLTPRRLAPEEVPDGPYSYRKHPAFVAATGAAFLVSWLTPPADAQATRRAFEEAEPGPV